MIKDKKHKRARYPRIQCINRSHFMKQLRNFVAVRIVSNMFKTFVVVFSFKYFLICNQFLDVTYNLDTEIDTHIVQIWIKIIKYILNKKLSNVTGFFVHLGNKSSQPRTPVMGMLWEVFYGKNIVYECCHCPMGTITQLQLIAVYDWLQFYCLGGMSGLCRYDPKRYKSISQLNN